MAVLMREIINIALDTMQSFQVHGCHRFTVHLDPARSHPVLQHGPNPEHSMELVESTTTETVVVWHLGLQDPDVEHPTLAIEVKRRTRARDQLQAWVMEAMAQAEASAATAQERTGAVKTPVVVIEQTRWGHANEYYAVLRLNDLAELVGGDDD